MDNFTWCQIAYNNKWATKEQLKIWITSGAITEAQYKTITEEDFTA